MAFQFQRRPNFGAIVIPGAGALTIGSEISNSATAGSVVYPTVRTDGFRRVRPNRMGVSLTPASGSVVLTNLAFSVYVFKTADAPAAVGYGAALALTGVLRQKACKFPFAAASWTQPTGALSAGASAYQEVFPALGSIYTSIGDVMDFSGSEGNGEARTLSFIVQVDAAWNPATISYTMDIVLDLDCQP